MKSNTIRDSISFVTVVHAQMKDQCPARESDKLHNIQSILSF